MDRAQVAADMLKGPKAPWPSTPSVPVQLTLPRKDTKRTLRCDDGVLTVAFQMGRTGEARGGGGVQRYNGCMLHGGFTEMESDLL